MSDFSKKKAAVLFAGLFILIVAVLAIGFGLYLARPARVGGAEQVVILREGMSLREVSDSLEKRGIIRDKTIFMLWARLRGYSRMIKAGEYRLSSNMSPIRIISMLTRGEIITYSVTVPEGFSVKQIGGLLAEKELVDEQEFLSLTRNRDVLRSYGVTGQSLEGYLYPDTYQFGKGLSPRSIIDAMIKRFREVVMPYRERMEQTGMTLGEILTLASIVEKETGSAAERPIIASVFLNRLKKGMRLESDPTVIYGIKDFTGNLTREDLLKPTPYNTYVARGLPPGPIANPGLESIKAVIFPARTDYLYFVSKNDGSHHFSTNLRDHNRAVSLYQKRRYKRP